MTDLSRTSYEPELPDTPYSMTSAQETAHQEDPANGEGALAVLLCAVLVLAGPLALDWCIHLLSSGGASW